MIFGEISVRKRLPGVSEIRSWAFKRQDQAQAERVRFRPGAVIRTLIKRCHGARIPESTGRTGFTWGFQGKNETGKVN